MIFNALHDLPGRTPMHTDPTLWSRVRQSVLADGQSIHRTARREKLSRNTVRKMLHLDRPPRYIRAPRSTSITGFEAAIGTILAEDEERPQRERHSAASIFRELRDHHGYRGGYGSVRRYCRSVQVIQLPVLVRPAGAVGPIESLAINKGPKAYRLEPEALTGSVDIMLRLHRDRRAERAAEASDWINRLRGDRAGMAFHGAPALVKPLLDAVHSTQKRKRDKAVTALAHEQGFALRRISACLGTSRNTCRGYLRSYLAGGVEALLAPVTRAQRKADGKELKAAVFRTLHQPPKEHGINRTSWIMSELQATLEQQGFPVGRYVLGQIIRDAGWKWRKAKIVLTSQDPAYRERLAAVQTILANLTPDEAFFSIDEFGPFAVKMKAGRTLGPPDTQKTVPQWQKSKGCMIMTAALELSGNQVTHFYSERKNTAEMLRMMDVLLERYADRQTLYLSWDAASWHISKKLKQRIEEHNALAVATSLPRVETAPLPAGAQFLNVIEAVFSGMARAIIHNSDYPSVEAVRKAIDRYFDERNQYFRDNPKRAGNRIWGSERAPAVFTDSNNCKEPGWR